MTEPALFPTRLVDPRPRLDLDLERLAMTPTEVARLTRAARENRVRELTAEAHAILDGSIDLEVTRAGKELAGVVLLFSGGNDSTVLGHLTRSRVSHVAHANTGVGIEQTRQYVRDVSASWGLPLLERTSPREVDSYRSHVLKHGFPGTGMHQRIYQRLKERALELVRTELVTAAGGPRKARVVFVAGRRRTESDRRSSIPEVERRGSTVWASPLVNWTKLDMNTYRLMSAAAGAPVPTNEVSDLIHMSGECLCGCYAKAGEREELLRLFPGAMELVLELEAAIADRPNIPAYAKVWGWSHDQAANDASRVASAKPPPVGYLCGDCGPGGELVATPLW